MNILAPSERGVARGRQKMKTIMVIPAKGYSRRLAGKNMRLFLGHPLLAWSIVQGVAAVDEVWVSTDNDEIAEIADTYGAQVMVRGYKDTYMTSAATPVSECVNRLYEMNEIVSNDIVVFRQCTTPTLLPGDVSKAVSQFVSYADLYAAKIQAVGAEMRTVSMTRKVVSGISRALPLDCRCENNYQIVDTKAFLAVMNVATAMEPFEVIYNRPAEQYEGEHPTMFYYPVEPWQMTDVDTHEDFEWAELVAAHYILKGRDMVDVYAKG